VSAGNLAGRRILVTGGSGFIGRHVVSDLLGAGARVRVVDLQPHPDPDVDIVIGDIAEREVLDAALDGGFDGIVHLAAVTSVLRSLEHPERTFRTNVAATAELLEAGRAAGAVAVVFASTGGAITGPVGTQSITETLPLRPLTPYGATKAAAEMLMSAYTASYGVRCTALRLTNVYGPGMQAKDSIVARLMRAIRLQQTFEIYGDGRQVRDYVHALDVTAAVRLGITDDSWSGPVIIGSGRSLSVLEVIDAVRQVTGADIDVRHGPPRAGEMPAVIVENRRAQSLGWAPRFKFEDGLVGVWDEWSSVDMDAVMSGLGAVGAPVGGAR
jgi:UDP-glucose 4-epimerase